MIYRGPNQVSHQHIFFLSRALAALISTNEPKTNGSTNKDAIFIEPKEGKNVFILKFILQAFLLCASS